jgi:hypothetical protein
MARSDIATGRIAQCHIAALENAGLLCDLCVLCEKKSFISERSKN